MSFTYEIGLKSLQPNLKKFQLIHQKMALVSIYLDFFIEILKAAFSKISHQTNLIIDYLIS